MELEKIIEKEIITHGANPTGLAQKIRKAGYHRHNAHYHDVDKFYKPPKESEYCSCKEPRYILPVCHECKKEVRPTPKRKRIEKIDLSEVVVKQGLDGLGIVIRAFQDKINEILDRLNEGE